MLIFHHFLILEKFGEFGGKSRYLKRDVGNLIEFASADPGLQPPTHHRFDLVSVKLATQQLGDELMLLDSFHLVEQLNFTLVTSRLVGVKLVNCDHGVRDELHPQLTLTLLTQANQLQLGAHLFRDRTLDYQLVRLRHFTNFDYLGHLVRLVVARHPRDSNERSD